VVKIEERPQFTMFHQNLKRDDDIFATYRLPENPKKHTIFPTLTGTSVIGMKFNDGIVVAADTLGSFGSTARYRYLPRIMKVNDTTVMGTGGDYADFQFLKSVIEQKIIDEECLADGFTHSPKSIYSWLTRVMYNRRCKMNPLWNTVIVGGMQGGEPFLGYVDKLGVAYEAPSVASGYGAYIAQPLLRDALDKSPVMSEAEARQVIERCISVLFYRDARSFNEYQLAVVKKDGASIDGPLKCPADFSIASMIRGYE